MSRDLEKLLKTNILCKILQANMKAETCTLETGCPAQCNEFGVVISMSCLWNSYLLGCVNFSSSRLGEILTKGGTDL